MLTMNDLFVCALSIMPIFIVIIMLMIHMIRNYANIEDHDDNAPKEEIVKEIIQDLPIEPMKFISKFRQMSRECNITQLCTCNIEDIRDAMVQDACRIIGMFIDHPEVIDDGSYAAKQVERVDAFALTMKELIESILTRGHTISSMGAWGYFSSVNLKDLSERGIIDITEHQLRANEAYNKIK